MGKKISNSDYIKAARRRYEKDGEVEIDEGAKVSRGDDKGAYVQAWVWVYDNDTRGKGGGDDLSRKEEL